MYITYILFCSVLIDHPLQLLIVVLNEDSAEFAVTIVAIPIVLVLLAFCVTALKREIKWCAISYNLNASISYLLIRLMTVSLILMLASMSYFGMIFSARLSIFIKFPDHSVQTHSFLSTYQ